MPVNLVLPKAESLIHVKGIRLGYAMAHIRKPNRKDLLAVQIDSGSSVSGIFTTNKFCAAPVTVCKQNLASKSEIRALIVNTGNANAGTGEIGLKQANLTCEIAAEILNIQSNQILPFSTGVILESLPIDRIIQNLPEVIQNNNASWLDAAETIMTTDTQPKAYSRQINFNGELITITGISKGAGMIKPNMATMLAFIATDANITQEVLDEMLKDIAEQSFNCITIDGDTSTNDSFILISTNKCVKHKIDNKNSAGYLEIKQVILEAAQFLAQAIVRDGEGATKFITISVKNADSQDDAKKIAYSIAHSPLVKTAFFACDPNLGRILAAIGYAQANIQIEKIDMYLNSVKVVENGSRFAQYTEEQGQQVMKNSEIEIIIDLQQGKDCTKIWTCDLSHDYVSINADYRS